MPADDGRQTTAVRGGRSEEGGCGVTGHTEAGPAKSYFPAVAAAAPSGQRVRESAARSTGDHTMSTKHVVAVAAIAFSLVAGRAFAEGEGNGEPFALNADAATSTGRAFVAETGSGAYPDLTGNRVRPSSLGLLEPASGSEAPVQTANSMPRGFENGTVAAAQASRMNRRFASKSKAPAFLEVGTAWPRG